jgi:uncharacterized SAM-binding protein YcdF (DUF218 family)
MVAAVVVPGHGAVDRDGVYRITARCLRLVAEAEKLAETLSPAAVVFSGWSPNGGLTEAEQMKRAWRGPDVELVVEPTARWTAENASRTLPLLLERGVERAAIVCAAPHLLRTRLFFGRLYRSRGIATQFHVIRAAPPLASVAWELAALPLLPLQLRAARAELDRRRR